MPLDLIGLCSRITSVWLARFGVCVLALVTAFAIPASPAFAALDSKGTEFWLMFNENLSQPELTLFITGDTATTGTVAIPGLSFTSNFTVTPGTVTSVIIPPAAQAVGVDAIENKGIHVTSGAEVTVYGLNRVTATTDAYLGLPVDILGTQYINLGYANVNVVNGTQLGIVATQNATTVTITPTALSGNSRAAFTPYNITLNQGQTYQLRSATALADLTGTIITSNKPIGVYGGHQCANIPLGFVACDNIVEQLPSTDTWGKAFVTVPLATRTRGDTFRFLASTNNTQVSVNGAIVATLQRGQFHERIITGASTITSTQPILVAQYSNSSSYDGVTSDPFMMLIPPFEQFLASYTVTTPATGFTTNFINLAVPTSVISTVKLDNVTVPAARFTAIPGSAFSAAQLAVTLGSHNVVASLPFGTFVYGFASFDSYGYPGGQSLTLVATVTKVDLTPKSETVPVNTQQCVNATVTDQNNAPVSGVRVDFNVTGANPNVGFVNAGTDGVARYCYVGTNLGVDTIVGSVGTLSGSASKTWVMSAIARCDVDGNGSIDKTDIALIRAAIGQSSLANDARDGDGDGLITMLDVRQCTLKCTKPGCAP